MKCTSCNAQLISEDEFTQFRCPKCMEHKIVRCRKCRLKSNTYKCECGFEGP